MAELDIQISIEEGEWPSEEALHSLAERVLETAAVVGPDVVEVAP